MHKILAECVREASLIDFQQLCLDDGFADITAFVALQDDARRSSREVHISSLDFAWAFNSVSRGDIVSVLVEAGLLASFTGYIAKV